LLASADYRICRSSASRRSSFAAACLPFVRYFSTFCR
jgi:hypothetical protein